MKNWLMIQAAKVKKWGSEKVLTLTVTKLNELLMQNVTDALGPKEGMKVVFQGGMSLGHEFMMELAAHLEANFERIPAYGEAAWIMFAGKKPTTQSFESLEMAGEKIWVYRFTDDDNPFCRNISFPHRFCQFPAGAYQGASQTWAALTYDGAYHTLCRETKCKAAGDSYCEFMLVILRRELPLSFLEQHMPDLFEDIDAGFVDY